MSAIAVTFERLFVPAEPGLLERVMQSLRHRGPDGSDTWFSGPVGLGHCHFWTTPEEVNERQPLCITGLPFCIVFDGRLDNRAELLASLDLANVDGRRLSDAALALYAFDRWGRDCFARFIGEFALAIWDEKRSELVCARDALGDRGLFYSLHGTRFVAASEPWAVADALGQGLDETGLAHFMALRANESGGTCFHNVKELLPAHVLAVGASSVQTWRYWTPDLSRRLRGKSDEEYAEGFLPLLEESVRCRLRSNHAPAVIMSGGLDSTSVASLAACMVSPAPLTTLSYIFEELRECDERPYIDVMKAQYGIRSLQVACDDLWPYKHLSEWPQNPNQPDANLYRMVIERTYQHAHDSGLRVLLTGTYGDELYDGDEDWLADLLAEGRLGDAARELGLQLRHLGARGTWRLGAVQRAASRPFNGLPLLGRRERRGDPPAWLTPEAASMLAAEPPSDFAVSSRTNLLGLWVAADCVSEIFYASRHGLELRHPYRDRRLIEYVLALPAHQLYRFGQYKHVLRVAMRGILPEAIRRRSRPTTLLALLARGMEREREVLRGHVFDAGAPWRRFVRADWLEARWGVSVARETDGAGALVPWLCVSLDRFLEKRLSER